MNYLLSSKPRTCTHLDNIAKAHPQHVDAFAKVSPAAVPDGCGELARVAEQVRVSVGLLGEQR